MASNFPSGNDELMPDDSVSNISHGSRSSSASSISSTMQKAKAKEIEIANRLKKANQIKEINEKKRQLEREREQLELMELQVNYDVAKATAQELQEWQENEVWQSENESAFTTNRHKNINKHASQVLLSSYSSSDVSTGSQPMNTGLGLLAEVASQSTGAIQGNQSTGLNRGNQSTTVNQGNQSTGLNRGNQSTTVNQGNQSTGLQPR